MALKPRFERLLRRLGMADARTGGLALAVILLGLSCISGPPPVVSHSDSPPSFRPEGAKTPEEKDALIDWLAYHAVREQRQSGIPASITIAQAILETGWLKADTPTRRRMVHEAKNLFGIKGEGPAGSVEIETREYENGKVVTIMAKFRAYESYRQSFEDHTKLLMTSRYYRDALPHRGNPRRYIEEVAKNYATDPAYTDKVWAIVTRFNLTRFDTR